MDRMEWARRLTGLCVLGMALAAASCSDSTPDDAAAEGARRAASPVPASATEPAPGRTPVPQLPRVVFLGDSLTAGYGLAVDQAYPAVLQQRMQEAGYAFQVVNAGVSGDTSAGGLRRLEWSLRGDVAVLVLALGANDGLRGLPPQQLKQNLRSMIDTAQARDIDVLLAGMEAPPNFGPAYTREFREVYRELAAEPGVGFVPFLLEGVAGDPALNQADGMHPNAEGQRRVADLIWRALEPLLAQHATS